MSWLHALVLGGSVAEASGLDADGVGLGAQDGRSSGFLDDAPTLEGGTVAVGLRGSLTLGSLVRSAPATPDEVLVGTAVATRLQALGMVLPWLGAEIDLPVRLGATSDLDVAGTSLGDARVTAWVRPRLRGDFLIGAGLGLQAPTGSEANYSGAGRVLPRAVGSVRWSGPLDVTGSLGMVYEGAVDGPRALGGAIVRIGVHAGLPVGPAVLGAGLRSEQPLAKEVRSRRGTGTEVAVDGVVELSETWRTTVLISRSLSVGAGVPVWRASAGLVGTFGRAAEPLPPKAIEMQFVRLVDPDGRAVAGAELVFPDGEVQFADSTGRADWEAKREPPHVRAPGLEGVVLDRRSAVEVQLPWAAVPIHVQVATATGAGVEPTVTLEGEGAIAVEVQSDGTYQALARPGTYSLTVEADGYGRQARLLVVAPRHVLPIDVEVVLLEAEGTGHLDLTVVDPQGAGVSDAEVRLDGVSIGTVGGEMAIDGLAPKETAVVIDSRYFREESVSVDLTGGTASADLDLFYSPGTVRVSATGPVGPISDGLVYIEGPRALPSLRLGPTGEQLVQLSDGEWSLLLSSPAFGLQERALVVEPEGPVPLEAAFVLTPHEDGAADLVLRAVDVDGRPLDDVEILLNGQLVGRTATGGRLRLYELQAGTVAIEARGTGLETFTREVVLRDGVQVVPLALDWGDGTLRVAARSPSGPVDAQVDFSGPVAFEGGRLGEPGRRLFTEVPEGEWELLASHASGMEVAWATVGGSEGRLTDVSIALGDEAGDGVLELIVEDPIGRPVSDAVVFLDGERLVQTASGGRVRVAGLTPGVRRLEIRHPWFGELSEDLDLRADTAVERTLAWRVGLLDVRATLNGEPITDGVLFAEGVRPLEPVTLGADGRATVQTSPGVWDLLLSSATGGLAEKHLEIADVPGPPVVVELELATGRGVVVTVVDPRGHPVNGAAVVMDGVELGTTNSSGLLVVSVDGPGQLTLTHPAIVPEPPIGVGASDAELRVEVEWAPRDVAVRAQSQDGPAKVRLTANGPGRVEPITVDGEGVLGLPPGRWEILASAGTGLGTVRQFVEVPVEGIVPSVSFDLGAARVRRTAEGMELVNVKFAAGEDIAGEAFAPLLEEIAATIVADPRIEQVEVQGHTDPTGGPGYNFDLSRRRAASVVEALTALGVPPSMLVARGFGPSRPVADNDTPQGRATNRRVDFRTVLTDVD